MEVKIFPDGRHRAAYKILECNGFFQVESNSFHPERGDSNARSGTDGPHRNAFGVCCHPRPPGARRRSRPRPPDHPGSARGYRREPSGGAPMFRVKPGSGLFGRFPGLQIPVPRTAFHRLVPCRQAEAARCRRIRRGARPFRLSDGGARRAVPLPAPVARERVRGDGQPAHDGDRGDLVVLSLFEGAPVHLLHAGIGHAGRHV